jgi:hypothetical protein
MPPATTTKEKARVTVTSWDYVKDNFWPEDRLAVVIKNQEKDQVIQRMDTAKNIASPEFQKWLRYHNAHGGDVYLSVNALRPEAMGRTRQDLQAIRHVYLDIDTDGPAVLNKVMTDPRIPKPNYVLNTSPGKYQILWKVQEFTLGQAERLQRIMAGEVGADRTVVDAARVLRIPGFYNKKYSEPHQVIAQKHSDQVYKPEDFKIQLPEFDSDWADRTRTSAIKGTSAAQPRAAPLSQSERDWAYAKRKLSQGYDPEEVIQAIRDYRPDKHNPERYARYTVEKAQAELHSADSSHEESRTPVDR